MIAGGLVAGGVAGSQACRAWIVTTSVRIVPPMPYAYGEHPTVEQLSQLGRSIFNDAGLSASGTLSCASCHEPNAAFGPSRLASKLALDGDATRVGTRAIASLRYAQYSPLFTEHYIDDEDNHGEDAGPTGGLTWDGRADNSTEQARIPLFATHEMGNRDEFEFMLRIRRASYATEFQRVFSAAGASVFDDARKTLAWALLALETYQQSPVAFAPFSSKYDRVLRGEATLAPAEARGLALFNDESKGHCASCHPSVRSASGALPLFTDHGFIALGVPRRAALPVPRGAADFDLGLCTSGRPGLSADPSYCGRFKVPTLRNVALRPRFFHNGVVQSLREAVAFYATRDTDPGHWYSKNPDGTVHLYDDLPADTTANVYREPPFTPMASGKPRLSAAEIDDIVAFLNTLTDADAAAP